MEKCSVLVDKNLLWTAFFALIQGFKTSFISEWAKYFMFPCVSYDVWRGLFRQVCCSSNVSTPMVTLTGRWETVMWWRPKLSLITSKLDSEIWSQSSRVETWRTVVISRGVNTKTCDHMTAGVVRHHGHLVSDIRYVLVMWHTSTYISNPFHFFCT